MRSTNLPSRLSSLPLHKVVVTGIGMLTPLASGTTETWAKILRGESGIGPLDSADEEFSNIPAQIAGRIRRGNGPGEFDPSKSFEKGEAGRLADFMQYAIVAADEALHSAGYEKLSPELAARTGVSVGTGIGSLEDICEAQSTLTSRGYRRVSPMFIPRVLINLAAGHISIRHRLQGPNISASTACATGAHAIGDAFQLIRTGKADMMVAGASEASVSPLSMAGFCKIKALCTAFNDNAKEGSRPFDSNRSGFVMGEGAAILLLERSDLAEERGAKVLAEIRGYGMSGDANHITAPPEDGSGAYSAMLEALRDANLRPEHIDYINAHATSTPLGDAAEVRAIERLEGLNPELRVSSTKGATGHLLGAAGALEAALTVMAVHTQTLPPTLNLQHPDPLPTKFKHVKNACQHDVKCAISNSFGFGGTNTSLLFTKYSKEDQ